MADLIYFQANILLFPTIEGLLGDARFANHLCRRHTHFSLLQDPDNLFDRNSSSLHDEILLSDFAENSP